MTRKVFIERLIIACSILERLDMDKNVCIDSTLQGYLSIAIGCINNLLDYTNESSEHD